MHRVATIRIYEMFSDVVASCVVTDGDEELESPGRTSTASVQVPGTGDDHPFRWMREALETLSRAYPEGDDGE